MNTYFIYNILQLQLIVIILIKNENFTHEYNGNSKMNFIWFKTLEMTFFLNKTSH